MNQLPAAQKERRSVEALLRDPKVIKGLEGVATQYLTPDRMARIAVNAIRRTPKLADCNPQSVLGAVMLSCSLGLEPNTPMGQAYLIPYDKRGKLPDGKWGVIDTECQFIIGYRGFISLAKRNPRLVKLYAATVHEYDDFDFCEGSESFLKFRPAMKKRGAAIGAFCFTKERGEFGDTDSATVLPMEELEKIRSCSETYNFLAKSASNADTDYSRKKAEEKLADTPWVKWFGEMAAKSAIRRHVKQLDLTAHLSAAVAIDEAGDSGPLDMSRMMDADYTRAVVDGEELPEVIEQEQAAPQIQAPPKERIATPTKHTKPKPAPAKTTTAPAAPVKQTQAPEWLIYGADGKVGFCLGTPEEWAETMIDWVSNQDDLDELTAILDHTRTIADQALQLLPAATNKAITAAITAKRAELQAAQSIPHDPETGEIFDTDDLSDALDFSE